MSLFGKIKSAVRGNPVTRDYELGRHLASAGPGLLWKVHAGVKKTSKQEVCIFVFDKKAPELEKLPKKQKEQIFDMLKKGPNQLIKLRHPRLLMVEHQVEESSDTLAFVTEPIFASLANLLGHYDNMPSPLPLLIKEHHLHPIEVQYGLLQVAEALTFLHSSVKMIHGNISPSNVVVTSHGAWKLLGFNFCCYSHYQTDAQKSFAFQEWDSRGPIHTNPSLDYLAPEYILSKTCDAPSDVYSFGMLSYAVYNGGRPLFENNNNMLSYKQNVELISRITEGALGHVPDEVKGLVRTMLAVEPSVRPDALEVSKHSFYDEVAVSTLKYLDTLFEKKDIEKSQFFKKSLARVITKLPKRMVQQHVLPPLSEEFRNHKMIPFVLPLVLLIAEDCTLSEYADLVLPVLTPAMKIQDPIQIPLIFLQKMDLLLKMTSQDAVQRHVLPMIIKSLEAENGQVQELCVTILPTFASMVDYSSMKHSIVPRITVLCRGAKVHTLQIKCLVCLGQLLDILDKHIVLDQILPTLHQISSREPGVLMAMLGIFHQTLTNSKLGFDKKILAETVIPFLLPISIEPSLNVKQFKQFIWVIREMLSKVESDQASHLQQMAKMEEQTKSTVEFAREVAETKTMDDAINRLEGMITGVDPKEESVTAKRGDVSVRSSAVLQPVPASSSTSIGPGSANTNFMSGFNLAELSNSFSRNSTFPINTATPTQTSATGSLLSTTPSSQPTPPVAHKVETLRPTKGNTPYQTMPLVPMQKEQQSNGLDLLSGSLSSSTKKESTLSGSGASKWSSGLLGSGPTVPENSMPSSSNWSSNLLGSISTSQTSQSSKTGIFSGLELGGAQSPSRNDRNTATGMFGGMNVNQSSPSSSQRGGKANQQHNRASGSQGMAQPLIPVNRGSSGTSSSAGWSSNTQQGSRDLLSGIQGSDSPLQSHSTGWSGNIGGSGPGSSQGQSSGMGWSQAIGENSSSMQGSGMGMNMPGIVNPTNVGMNNGSYQQGVGIGQRYNSEAGLNWSSNIQPQQQPLQSLVGGAQPSYGQSQQQPLQPTASAQRNYGQQLQQPLQPTGQVKYGQAQQQQPMQPTFGEAQSNSVYVQPLTGGWGQGQQQTQQQLASGANPFADLSFLS